MSIGKNSAFLNSFWDLASDEKDKRITAASQIIVHIKCQGGAGVDTDYALKRLVRGLGSSRESARQGFVSCLCELLITVESINTGTTLSLIDDNTKITGSMKGAEERDLMFGKLFGYLSLIRSGKLLNDEKNVLLIMDQLLDLHNRKGWIREVVCEAFLTLLEVINNDIIILITPKFQGLLGNGATGIADMTAWQIMLCVGIQRYALQNTDKKMAAARAGLLGILPTQAAMVTPETLSEMVPTLVEATAGFPKLHRVWDFIMSSIYPMDKDRILPRTR
jgi:DNA polymerase phi